MSTEEKPFRALSVKELRALPAHKQADYLGQLAARNRLDEETREHAQADDAARFDERKARRCATLAGIAALAAAWAAIYVADIYMRRSLEDDFATGITMVASLVVIPLVFYVRARYLERERIRYCSKNGRMTGEDVSRDSEV